MTTRPVIIAFARVVLRGIWMQFNTYDGAGYDLSKVVGGFLYIKTPKESNTEPWPAAMPDPFIQTRNLNDPGMGTRNGQRQVERSEIEDIGYIIVFDVMCLKMEARNNNDRC